MMAIARCTRPLCLAAAIAVMLMSPAMWAKETSGHTVVIDAGHGGKDPGTRSREGLIEKDVNLAIALAVSSDLRRQGVTVVLTRDQDTFVSLDRRVEIANQSAGDLFVSIHCDFNADPGAKGFSVLVPRSGTAKAVSIGCGIGEDLQAGGIMRHAVRRDNRGLRVLERTRCPAVLVEAGFLSNSSEAARLRNTPWQEKIASSLTEGILEYLNHP